MTLTVVACRLYDPDLTRDSPVDAPAAEVRPPDAGVGDAATHDAATHDESDAAIIEVVTDAGVSMTSPDAAIADREPAPVACASECPGSCAGELCVIDCSMSNSCQLEVRCPAGLTCAITCGNGACDRIRCEDGATCDIACVGNRSCQGEIECEGDCTCSLACTGNNSCSADDDC